jgi:hypothetical protein
LPGHGAGESQGDQPLLVIGDSPTGLLVSDPTFSSTLGYGIEIDDVALLKAWQAASAPMQALAFSRAPQTHDFHLATAESPAVVPRIVMTPPPSVPASPPVEAQVPAPATIAPPTVAPALEEAPLAAPTAAAARPERGEADWPWLVLAFGALLAGGTVFLKLKLWRGGRGSASRAAAAAPRQSDQ